MIDKKIYKYLLSTDGVNQLERSPLALDPASVKIDGRSRQDILRFLLALSGQIRFYDLSHNPLGDWRPFLQALTSGNDILPESILDTLYKATKDAPPHLALLMAFLKVYSHLQQDVNKLSAKRLKFYYEEALGIQRRAATADQVHVVFEPAKNAGAVLIKAGTLLDAGKTKEGAPLQYALNSDLVVNHTLIGSLRSSYIDFNAGGKSIIFKTGEATGVLNKIASAWRPLGATQLLQPVESRTMQPVQLGWAVASPNFFMAEGRRIIKLSVVLKSSPGAVSAGFNLASMLDITLTGEKEWLKPDQIIKAVLTPQIPVHLQNPEQENPFVLDVWVQFNESSPALTAYREETHQGSFVTQWPLMRVLLKPESFMLEALSGFRVEQITIAVEVTGVKNLILQNDHSLQPADKPVLPFGNTPLIGSRFYIGSEEIFSKTLTSLRMKLEWQDPPEDIVDHYGAYGNSHIALQDFKAEADLLSARNWNIKLLIDEPLFVLSDTSLVREMYVHPVTFETQTANSPFRRNPALSLPASYDNTVNQGFIRMVLSGPTRSELSNEPPGAPFEAFGHKTFPFAYTQQVIALSKHDGNGTAPELPRPPYTPTLKSISLDYSAKDTFRPDTPNYIDQYFVQDVFGPAEAGEDDRALLIAEQPGNGSLYIGLENSTPPQLVSLLFQIEEGSVPGATLLRSEDLNWSYLAGNHWRTIAPADVIEESTQGLQRSGLIRLNIGGDASLEHTRMPAAQRWLRLSVANNPEGAAAVAGIFIQAGSAKLVFATDTGAYEEHLSSPLPAGSISTLAVKIPSIKKVQQPFPSFGGRASETDGFFYQRVSERLRHKNRAVTGWDYRRLLLEFFPEIYKVKCLPHSNPADILATHPGNVWLVVVPDWRKHPSGDPLQPNANRSLLREITEFITNRFTSPFTTVHITNPTYETLLVDCKVSFHAGFDPGYYSSLLNEDLKKFLSPWAYSEGKDIVFGGKIHASEILAFIEGREYVDFVVDFELYHRHQGYQWGGIGDMEIDFDFIIGYSPEPTVAVSATGEGGKTINLDFVVGEPVEIAEATRPDTILVSNASHRIEALQAGAFPCEGIQNIGIGQMIVGLDFVPIS